MFIFLFTIYLEVIYRFVLFYSILQKQNTDFLNKINPFKCSNLNPQ